MKVTAKSIFLLIMGLLIATLGACSATPADEGAADEITRVALLLPGRIDDMSFNQDAYEGLMALDENLGEDVEVTFVEGVYEVVDIEPALRDYADQGYDLVIGHGFQFQDPIMEIADQYPDVNFAIGPGAFMTAPNVSLYDQSNGEVGYIMGSVAGLATDSNVIGSVGGMDVPNVHVVHEVFKVAAKEVNSEAEVIHAYTGDFTDAEAAREATLSMVDQGADLIYVSGDGITVGGLEAAQDEGALFMTNSDMSQLAPEIFLANLIPDYGVAFENMIEDIKSGNFGEKKYELSFQNGGLQLVIQLDEEVQDVRDQIDEIETGLVEGTIEIPEVSAE